MVLPIPDISVAQAYEALRGQGINTKSYFQNILVQINATPVEGEPSPAVNSQYFLAAIASAMNTLSMAQGMAANVALSNAFDNYVRAQMGDPNFDVHGALTTAMHALGVAAATMISQYPKDASGNLLDRSFDSSGNVVAIDLSPGSLTASAAAMTSWLATIS